MNKYTLFLMQGLPCSGKSTLSKEMAKEWGIPRICPDEVRTQLYGHDYFRGGEDFVWATVKTMIKTMLKTQNVILDACNLNPRTQGEFRSKTWNSVYIVMETDKDKCLNRAIANLRCTEYMLTIDRMSKYDTSFTKNYKHYTEAFIREMLWGNCL